MDLDILVRLEQKIDQLVLQKQQLENDCQRLNEENALLVQEKDFIGQEIDRILSRLDSLDQETS